MHAASILPILAFLATANAAAINRADVLVARNAEIVETKVVNGVTLSRRANCWFDPLGLLFDCNGNSGKDKDKDTPTPPAPVGPTPPAPAAPSSSSSSASASKSSSSSSSSSSSASASKSSSSSSSASSSSSSSASKSSSSSSSSAAPTSSSSSSAAPTSSSSSSSASASKSSSSSSSSASSSSSSVVVVPSSSSSSVASSVISSVSSSSTSSSSSAVTSTSSAAPTSTSTSTSTSTATSSTSTVPAAPTNAAVSGWKYVNAIAEGTNGRALTAAATAGQGMTVETCLAYCDSLNFPLAGLEYGAECYCGTVLSNGASTSKTGTATMACAGNAQELCGGPSLLSFYASTKSNAAGLSSDYTSQAVSLPAGWSSNDCIQEVSGRALVEKSTASDDMTIGKCLAFCGNDFKYAGLEYGRECYCGNTLSNGASLSSTSGQCVTPCAGMSTNTCGGPNAVQLYSNANYKAASTGNFVSSGCVQEVVGRALRGAATAGPSMTIETCTSFCASQGFKIAGLEYGQECYCDNTWQGGAGAWSGQCNMPCAGNAGENCGGPNAINVYTSA